ncbi:beta-ketoacyl synthase N-terminal-like domain-containing protein [Rhizobium leguminosarum]|uniref:beta-ketoacyl synthase N-terminal-like domain-containing protein n=1 Tax=Rhizobium leguminosarum TaxID=384 RepID=UPI003ECD014D
MSQLFQQTKLIAPFDAAVVTGASEFEDHLVRLLLYQLRVLGVFNSADIKDGLGRSYADLNPRYERWLSQSLHTLQARGYVEREGDAMAVVAPSSTVDSAWKEWETYKALLSDTSQLAQSTLVDETLRALPAILTAKKTATEVIFPNSSMKLVEDIYRRNSVSEYFNDVLSESLLIFLKQRFSREPQAKLRMIEIGAGTGGTSALVFEHLAAYSKHIDEYCYTDISKAFLLHADTHFKSRVPYLQTTPFNVELSPVEQGIEIGTYDVAIATNVLHATKNIRQTLRNAKALLKKGGLLLINEMAASSLFAHLTFGLLEGWWLYDDAVLRIAGSPAIMPQTWREILQSEGLNVLGYPAEAAHELGQQIIVAESNGVIRLKQPRAPDASRTGIARGIPGRPISGPPTISAGRSAVSERDLHIGTINYLKQLIADTLKMSAGELDESVSFEEYGIDSIVVVQITNALRGVFDGISSTLLFEHQTVETLALHFIEKQRGVLIEILRLKSESNLPAKENISRFNERALKPLQSPQVAAKRFQNSYGQALLSSGEIAIIGLGCRYPDAWTCDQFWANLKSGVDSVTEIPAERWDHSEYFDPEKGKPGMSYSKWGGFIDEVDRFDPLFFNISPHEADIMDPRERLFLENVWKLLEGAGHTRASLHQRYRGQIGVYVGASGGDIATIANRTSYYFGLEGPSIAIDTMCSSSAMAIHLACRALLHGECELAIAGGVNLAVHPRKYVDLSQLQMIGSHPNSRSFGDGDGFLPAEGVGTVLLKPLAKAVQDGDAIHAVIKATATKHSGRSNGYSVPNLNLQAEVAEESLRQAGIDPRTLSYVEAAANGSALGDPIEVAALTKVLNKAGAGKQSCALGSVKSNLGHPEAASGVAQLTKVVLQLQHQQLAPSIKAEPLNPNLRLDETPFALQTELADWHRPILEIDGKLQEVPRRALIDSYGAGGTYVSLVVEEYARAQAAIAERPDKHDAPQLCIFSARNADRLQALVGQMLLYVEQQKELELSDLAYTLQVAREAMEIRLALVVRNQKELVEGLTAYLAASKGKDVSPPLTLFTGDIHDSPLQFRQFLQGELGNSIVQTLVTTRDLEKLAIYWIQGGSVPWPDLHDPENVRKIALPTYPFARQKFKTVALQELRVLPAMSASTAEIDNPTLRDTTPASYRVPFDATQLTETLRTSLAEVLKMEDTDVRATQPLQLFGFGSTDALRLKHKLEQQYHCELPLSLLARRELTVTDLANDLIPIILTGFGNPSPGSLTVADPHDMDPVLPLIVHRLDERYLPFPLTDIQESFLVGGMLEGNGKGASVYLELELRGAIDIDRLNQAFQRLIMRHDMLRMVVEPSGEQVVLRQTPLYWIKVRDCSDDAGRNRPPCVNTIREEMQNKIYRPDSWPLFDVRLSLQSTTTSTIHFGINELLVDATSLNILMREWSHLYHNPDTELLDLDLTFRDYVLAQKAFEKTARHRRDMAYWLEHLQSMPSGPALPTPAPNIDILGRGSVSRFTGSLSSLEWAALKARADDFSISPTVLLLTIFSEVIRAQSTNKSFSLILTLLNRLPVHQQINKVVGPAISTSIFVVGSNLHKEFGQIATMHQHQLWTDLDHSTTSGVRVMRELKRRRIVPASLQLPMVFTSMLDSSFADTDAWPEGEITFAANQTPQVLLDHQVSERAGCLNFTWDVPSGHFAEGFVEDLFAKYCRILTGLASGELPWSLDIFVDRPVSEASALAKLPDGFSFQEEDDRNEPFPLTDQQHAYAFGRNQHIAGSDSCQVYQEIEAKALDVERLQAAWNRLLQVHPMLRTIVGSDGQQRVLEIAPDFPIKVERLSGLNNDDLAVALAETRREMLARVAALDGWPFFDLRVTLLNEDDARIHLTIDMLIADGRSIGLIISQLLYLYDSGKDLDMPEISFRDYQCAVERFRGAPAYVESIQYWKNKFSQLPSGPRLPERSEGEPLLKENHRRFGAILADWSSFKEQAQVLGLQTNVSLLGAYLEVLYEWNEKEPLSVVVPTWERLPVHKQINNVVGDFTALGWVTRREDNSTFKERVKAVGAQLADDLAQRPVSGISVLRRFVSKTTPPRLKFPVVFTDNTPPIEKPPEGFAFGQAFSKTGQVFLDNISIEHDGQLYCFWDSDVSIFPESMIREMFDAYVSLLRLLARDPTAWLDREFSGVINARVEVYTKRRGKNRNVDNSAPRHEAQSADAFSST